MSERRENGKGDEDGTKKRGETSKSLGSKQKKIMKGKERRNKRVCGERKKRKKRKKNKVVQIFLRCSDGQSLIARELKLVYSTRATIKYQERKDSMLHAPRGRGFSYSGSFSFKGRRWPCGSDPTIGLSFRP